MEIATVIAGELNVKPWQVEAAIGLIDQGNTIPFIARYRKEVTGALDDEALRNLDERLSYLRSLEQRKEEIISSIDEQGKLTDELKERIEAADKLVTLEDLYRPYKQKKSTRASIAKARGLEPLADFIAAQSAKEPLENEAKKYVTGPIEPASESKEDKIAASSRQVLNEEEAIAGAGDIIAERISDNADYREYIRQLTFDMGKIKSAAKEEGVKSVYENYYDYEEAISSIAGHRILAINRGEAEKILTVKLIAPQDRIMTYLEKMVITADNQYTTPVLKEIIDDAYKRLIAPSIEREVRSSLTAKAEDGAIEVFGKNLKQLLMQPPISDQTVLGWDPAFRTGCKLSVVDPTGKVLDTCVIFPTEPQKKIEESKKVLKQLIEKYHITLISVGNGTASRESEQVIVELLHEIPEAGVQYVITNEAGASVYSASKLASEEFPNFDVGQRSATSIARRLQDPLSELVKIDPKSIGVGQYQHDMNPKKLGDALSGVVESSVNEVGVDANTASAALLGYISGIGSSLAKGIVSFREKNGRFSSREDFKKVPKLGPKAFQQCAGFMRINGGDEPLDSTSVHPESYEAARLLLKKIGCEVRDERAIRDFESSVADMSALAKEIGVGEMTLSDILRELKKPARDPREDMPKPILRSDILEMKDLKPGMVLRGTVRNVIDFGAFVDIGVHQDGLVHISQITDRFIRHPLDALSVGDVVDVKVLDVDSEKGRISLTMKLGEGKADTRASHSRREDGSNRGAKGAKEQKGQSRGKSRAGKEGAPLGQGRKHEKYAPGTIGYILAHQQKR